MLHFLMLVLISVSAVYAADLDDNNNMVVSSYDVEILSSANDYGKDIVTKKLTIKK
ncbi:MAG: hypothetical protein IKF13_01950 [Methanobrevibacter sp.]|nr:hypothetical protein [Methanobrevibacter sp.]